MCPPPRMMTCVMKRMDYRCSPSTLHIAPTVTTNVAHLAKVSHLSDVTCHLRVAGLNLPVEARGFFVLSRAGPVDSRQEPLGQRGSYDYIQLAAVD